MTEVRLRNVDPGVVDAIRAIARENRRTLEAEIKDALARLASARKDALLDRIARERGGQGVSPDSAPGIRAERDARW
ncbi:MAG: hypothetical protein C0501_21330 [Isosphaera sp.]|nr:hypothetical protein [Isosphaera sp.]